MHFNSVFTVVQTTLLHFTQLYNYTQGYLAPLCPGFPLYFLLKFKDFSRTLKLHFQGPILDGSLQHGQYYSNI